MAGQLQQTLLPLATAARQAVRGWASSAAPFTPPPRPVVGQPTHATHPHVRVPCTWMPCTMHLHMHPGACMHARMYACRVCLPHATGCMNDAHAGPCLLHDMHVKGCRTRSVLPCLHPPQPAAALCNQLLPPPHPRAPRPCVAPSSRPSSRAHGYTPPFPHPPTRTRPHTLATSQPSPTLRYRHHHCQLMAAHELTPGIPALEYAARRQRLANILPSGGAAIMPAAATTFMSGAIPYPYRQVMRLFTLLQVLLAFATGLPAWPRSANGACSRGSFLHLTPRWPAACPAAAPPPPPPHAAPPPPAPPPPPQDSDFFYMTGLLQHAVAVIRAPPAGAAGAWSRHS